ncbi:MAG: TSUP family transporter [Rhodospirillales bacterium]|nr:TSUP family transporter [Rhodospirillales bacterium]
MPATSKAGAHLIDTNTVIAGVLANLAIAGGAAAQASIGLGLNLFAVPILALIDPVFVPGPVLVHSFLVASAASYRLRQEIRGDELGISTAGLLAGTAAAALLLTQLDQGRLPRVLGVLVVAAVALTAAGYRIALTRRSIATASATAGIMGTIAGVHGPPIALLYQHETPARIRSALLPFFAVANFISLVALAAIGMLGWRQFEASLLLVPGLIAGFLAAPWLIRLMSARMIRACILAISAISGLALVLKN